MFWHHISALQYCNSTTITNYRLFTGHESGHINRVILLQGAGRWLGVGGGWSLVNNISPSCSSHTGTIGPFPLLRSGGLNNVIFLSACFRFPQF